VKSTRGEEERRRRRREGEKERALEQAIDSTIEKQGLLD
jgi:hypothetical protein